MKVCFYGISAQMGGAERSLFDLIISLKDEFDVFVVLPQIGPLVDALTKSGIRVIILPLPSGILKLSRGGLRGDFLSSLVALFKLPQYFWKMIFLLKREHPKIIHTTGLKCHLFLGLASPVISAKILMHIRDIFPEGKSRSFLRWVIKMSRAGLIFNSKATQVALASSPLFRGQTFEVVYNGLDPVVYSAPANQTLKAEWKLASAYPIIATVGVLARWKGQIEFLRIAKKLTEIYPQVHFLIVGGKIYDTSSDSGYEAELKAKVCELGLIEKVTFTGFRQDIPAILKTCDLLVHTSTQPEPFGRVVLEAMASKVPVVASSGGGVNEFVLEGETGLLANPLDADSMVRQMRRVLDDPQFRNQMVQTAYAQFLSKFTLNEHALQITVILKKLS